MSSRRFVKGDRVLVSSLKSSVTKRSWLSPPLRLPPPLDPSKYVSESNKTPNGYPPNTPLIHLNFGKLAHTDIIDTLPSGKIYQVITPKQELSAKYRITNPTLEEYINLTSRKAQPIYALDASAIVTLMDLHLDAPNVHWNGPQPVVKEVFQFLEAGTGHGSLSLAIARALHPANVLARIMGSNPDTDNEMDYRGAILHSVDCNEAHSRQGQETVTGFRRGQYAQNVEFHISDSPSQWLDSESSSKWSQKSIPSDLESTEYKTDGKAWLDGIFLDMPSYDKHLVRLCKDLKVDGRVIVFCPSITQILDGVKLIDSNNDITHQSIAGNASSFPFTAEGAEPAGMLHEKTIQLLPGMGGGLQEWDTRRTLIKATGEEGYSVRPKVGMRTVAGGFISIWRKVSFNEVLYGNKPTPKPESTIVDIDFEQTDKSADGKIETITEGLERDVESTTTPLEISGSPEIVTESTDDSKVQNAPKFKAYTFESNSVESNENSVLNSKLSNKPPLSDFMKRFLSEEPLPSPETAPLKLTLEEQKEALKLNKAGEYELPTDEKVSPTRLFPIECLHTVYKNCSGETYVGYITHVNVVDVGKLPEYAFEGQIKPTGPSNK